MRVKRSANILVIRETPGCLWILGVFFAVIGTAFVYGSLGGYTNFDEAPPWVLGLHFFGGICAIAAGYWVLFFAPITTVIIDRNTRTVSIRRKGITGKTDTEFVFDEVGRFDVFEEFDSDGDDVYTLGLVLADERNLTISSLSSPLESDKRDLAFEANQFMGKQMPSYRNAAPETEE